MPGSSRKPGAIACISQGMAAMAATVSASRTKRKTARVSSAKRRAAASPSSSRRRAKSGTKAALKAPSAKIRRNMLGKRKATKKASAAGPVPRTGAISTSRRKPRTRLPAVQPLTVAT